MKVLNSYLDVDRVQAALPDKVLPGIFMRNVISAEDRVPNFRMRVVEFEPGASCPRHSHWWEHQVFVLSGQGTMVSGDKEITLAKDMVIYIAPNEEHGFANSTDETLCFVCLVPLAADE